MGKIKNENYILIQGFMVNELKLKGNELLIYAIIYGFSQEDVQVFGGSLQYLSDWTNISKQSVINCLKSLVDKGYIEKRDKIINNVKFVEYYSKNLNRVVKKLEWGSQKTLPNNIDIYNIDIKERNKDNKLSLLKNGKNNNFIKPTLEEVKSYCLERNNGVDAEYFINYYEAIGWKVGKNNMKDWKACVRTWERRTDKKVEKDPSKMTKEEQKAYYRSLGYIYE